jgi:MFS transporter, FHS family, L-fucose permease
VTPRTPAGAVHLGRKRRPQAKPVLPRPHTPPARSGVGSRGLFQGADGNNAFRTFALLSSLFLLWGFGSGLIDILNKHFQDSLHITKAQSGLVQFSYCVAYFLMAMPAGLLARKFGYQSGLLAGLGLLAGGAAWFIPATQIGTYWAFLTGVFVVASGMTFLETIANPYITLLGTAPSGATRINIAQTFNGLGRMLGPIVGGQFLFSGGLTGQADHRLYIPYLGVGLVAAGLLGIFALIRMPDPRAEEAATLGRESNGRKPWWRRSHFTLGVAAQFFYLAAQTGIFSFFVNYVLENDPGVTNGEAANWLGAFGFGLFLSGRLCGSVVMGRAKPHRVLAVCAILNVLLTTVVLRGGTAGLYALGGTFFFMSIMFPTIFALAIRGLGEDTKLGSSLLVMSMVGGGIAPLVMGKIADGYSMRAGFVVPLGCFVLIAIYGIRWPQLEGRDRAGEALPVVIIRPKQ